MSRISLWAVVVMLLATAGSASAVAIYQVPEPVSTVGLLAISIVGLAAGRKFFRK